MSSATLRPKTSTSTAALALNFIEDRPDPTSSSASLVSQLAHRQELISYWDVQPGSKVLEIGCGQGDTTVALADAVDDHVGIVNAQGGLGQVSQASVVRQFQAVDILG